MRLTTSSIKDYHMQASSQTPADKPQPNFKKGNPEQTTQVRPASSGSIKYMRDLIAERYPDATEEYIQSVIDQGQGRVSKAIDNLKEMPKVGSLNLYPGKCDRCKARVGVNEGIRRQHQGRWIIEHRPNDCPRERYGIPLGRYATRDEDETVRFYWIQDEGIFAQASEDYHRIDNPKTQREIIEKIKVDVQGAAILYGLELGVCGRCGKTLTSEWRNLGIGPVCAEKEGWVV